MTYMPEEGPRMFCAVKTGGTFHPAYFQLSQVVVLSSELLLCGKIVCFLTCDPMKLVKKPVQEFCGNSRTQYVSNFPQETAVSLSCTYFLT